ncbi:MAG TPA: ABC transporter permease [Candidatus Limnocylindrales bacterium]|nr:ABC transporter permease [Candidatus Limnocylindrales bacterium]
MDWGWILDHLDDLAFRTAQHLYLTAIALAIGLAISFALALLAVRRRSLYPPIAGLASIVFTIPSLALFAAFVSITGISVWTAEIPLILYTFVMYVRNIVAGFDSVPPEVREAADGMGYGRLARLWRIELPLAVPLIIAGIRVAAVSTIGLVTITGILGDRFGGLGFFIFEGIARGYFATEMLLGAVPSIVLALLVDRALVLLQRRLTPWAHPARPGSAPEPAAA